MMHAADKRDCLESAGDYLLEAADLVGEALPGHHAQAFREAIDKLMTSLKRWDRILADKEAEEED